MLVVLLNGVFTHTNQGPMTNNLYCHCQKGFNFFLFKLETVNNSAAKKKKNAWKKPLIFGIIHFAEKRLIIIRYICKIFRIPIIHHTLRGNLKYMGLVRITKPAYLSPFWYKKRKWSKPTVQFVQSSNKFQSSFIDVRNRKRKLKPFSTKHGR